MWEKGCKNFRSDSHILCTVYYLIDAGLATILLCDLGMTGNLTRGIQYPMSACCLSSKQEVAIHLTLGKQLVG